MIVAGESGELRALRLSGETAEVVAVCAGLPAPARVASTWRRLDTHRGKRRTIVAVAVARELAGLCWAIAKTN